MSDDAVWPLVIVLPVVVASSCAVCTILCCMRKYGRHYTELVHRMDQLESRIVLAQPVIQTQPYTQQQSYPPLPQTMPVPIASIPYPPTYTGV